MLRCRKPAKAGVGGSHAVLSDWRSCNPSRATRSAAQKTSNITESMKAEELKGRKEKSGDGGPKRCARGRARGRAEGDAQRASGCIAALQEGAPMDPRRTIRLAKMQSLQGNQKRSTENVRNH
ncbi:unnamed protein product [Prorocentrum cordatum]|uniref:Uncharacterized protein n=1 Tax=Prorocentrum cordatum TaxID=2364126 RepID=A0ABN9SUK8_9DINO|nr:unnamed protein product [Polarella glacialis]